MAPAGGANGPFANFQIDLQVFVEELRKRPVGKFQDVSTAHLEKLVQKEHVDPADINHVVAGNGGIRIVQFMRFHIRLYRTSLRRLDESKQG